MNKKILAGVLAAGMAVAGCGSDDDESSTTNGSTASTPSAGSAPGTGDTPGGSDPNLDALHTTPLSATGDDRFISVAEGPDGAIYAAGFTSDGDDHLVAVTRFSAPGEIDTAFGDGGTVSVNLAEDGDAEVGRGLVVGDDGSVTVVSPYQTDPEAEGDASDDLDFAVIRITADGTLDDSFGEGGIARVDIADGRAVDAETFITNNAWGLTAREGGYAVFAVTPAEDADRSDLDFAVVGLTPTGELDPAFGEDGVVRVDLDESGDNARNIAVQADGKIVATGYSRNDGVVSPVLIRLSADGVLDDTFGEGGVASHPVLPGVAESYQFGFQGDAYVLAGYGRGANADEKVDLIAYRFLADGSWDETFGTDGVTRIDLAGEDDRGRNLVVLPDDRIVVVGSGKLDGENLDALVAVLDADGAPLGTFGDGGHALVDLGGPGDAFFGATLASDGTVLVAGFAGADPDGDGNDDAVIARLAL